MWDIRTVTTIYLTPDSSFAEVVVNKLTQKISEDLEIQEQYDGEVIAWVPENTSGYYRKLLVAAPDLLEALKNYGVHKVTCNYLAVLTSMPPQHKPCSCGLHDVISKATGEQI